MRKYPLRRKKEEPAATPESQPATSPPAKPGVLSPTSAIATVDVPRSILLRPAEDIEDTVKAFRLYQELKEKLLEETDYTWFVRYTLPSADKEKLDGFRTRKLAEEFLTKTLGGRGDLEKKVKKSGCLKLSKAFAISTQIVNAEIDPTARKAWYRVEAEGPNGQTQQRTGYCDGTESGKAKVPFDTIDATALTRATDRAIMALLGGENTAEEFESNPSSNETTAPPETKPPVHETTPLVHETTPPCPETSADRKAPLLDQIAMLAQVLNIPLSQVHAAMCERFEIPIATGASLDQLQDTIAHLERRLAESPHPLDQPTPTQMSEEELCADLDKKFNSTTAAPDPTTDKNTLTRAIFALGKEAGFKSDELKANIKQHFGVSSFTDLSVEQLQQSIAKLEERLQDPLARKGKE